LFSQKAFEIAHREIKARPVLQLADLGLPLLLDRTPLSIADGEAQKFGDEAQQRARLEAKASAKAEEDAEAPAPVGCS
jgi:hypothetical protein